MTYRQTQIKDLQMIIDQFLPGDYEINHAKMKHEGEDLEWFELLEYSNITKTKYHCSFSCPTWTMFQSEIISMIALQIETAKTY